MTDKIVIFNAQGVYCLTSYDNYFFPIVDPTKITVLNGFNNFEEIKEWLIDCFGLSPDNIIVIDY